MAIPKSPTESEIRPPTMSREHVRPCLSVPRRKMVPVGANQVDVGLYQPSELVGRAMDEEPDRELHRGVVRAFTRSVPCSARRQA